MVASKSSSYACQNKENVCCYYLGSGFWIVCTVTKLSTCFKKLGHMVELVPTVYYMQKVLFEV